MTRISSKKVVGLDQAKAKAKTHMFQALLYGLSGITIDAVAIFRYIRFDGTGYDSKMNATFDFMLFGFLGLVFVAISAIMYFRAHTMLKGKTPAGTKTGRLSQKMSGPLILLACLSFGCQNRPHLDSHGNPVFNSVALEDSIIHPEKGISANYYTVSNNIANPNSSVFVSKNPTEAETWDFVINMPSYFFIIHNKRELCAIAGLWPKNRDWLNGGWEWKIMNPNNGTERIIESEIKGPIAEHRLREYKNALAKEDHPYIEKGKSIMTPKGNRVYKIANYQDVFAEIISISEKKHLWEIENRP